METWPGAHTQTHENPNTARHTKFSLHIRIGLLLGLCRSFFLFTSSSQFGLSIRILAPFIHYSFLLSFSLSLLYFRCVFHFSVSHPHSSLLAPVRAFCSCSFRNATHLTRSAPQFISSLFHILWTVIKFCLCFCIFPILFYFSILMLIWPFDLCTACAF